MYPDMYRGMFANLPEEEAATKYADELRKTI